MSKKPDKYIERTFHWLMPCSRDDSLPYFRSPFGRVKMRKMCRSACNGEATKRRRRKNTQRKHWVREEKISVQHADDIGNAKNGYERGSNSTNETERKERVRKSTNSAAQRRLSTAFTRKWIKFLLFPRSQRNNAN